MEKIICEFEQVLKYKFNNKDLLIEALTHSSYANEHGLPSNERLEFLGDAVLELSMSKHLFSIIDLDEGVLTKTRAKAVCEEALDLYAAKINLPKFILLGKQINPYPYIKNCSIFVLSNSKNYKKHINYGISKQIQPHGW